MLKRSFIPPDFRPYVRGSKLGSEVATHPLFADLHDDRRRRQLIVDLAQGKRQLPEIDAQRVQNLLWELFPALKPSR